MCALPKVRTRLLIAFGTMVSLLLVVLAIGINRMSVINEGVHTITAENNPELEHATRMLITQYQITVHCRNFMLLTDEAKIKHESELFRDALAQMFTSHPGRGEKAGRRPGRGGSRGELIGMAGVLGHALTRLRRHDLE